MNLHKVTVPLYVDSYIGDTYYRITPENTIRRSKYTYSTLAFECWRKIPTKHKKH